MENAAKQIKPQLSKEGKKVRLQFCLAELFYGGVWATLSFVTLLLGTAGEMDSQQVGIVMSITSIFAMISAPVWGVIADKVGSRRGIFLLLMVGSGIGFAILPITAHIKAMGLSIIAFLLPAATFFRQPGSSMMDAMVVGATTHFPGMNYSSIRLWNSLGYTVVSPIYTILVEKFGLAVPFYGFCFFSLMTGILAFRIPEYDTRSAMGEQAPKEKLNFGAIFKNYYLAVFLVLNIIINLPMNTYWFLPYLIEEVGGNPETIGTLAGIRSVLEVLGLFAIPLMKKKLHMTQPQIICAATAVFAAELILYSMCTSYTVLAVVQCLNGLGFGLFLGGAADYVYALAPDGVKTTATALYGAGMGAAGVIGNAYAGWGIETIGVKGMFLTCGLAVAAALVLFVLSFLVRAKKEPAPVPLFGRSKTQA